MVDCEDDKWEGTDDERSGYGEEDSLLARLCQSSRHVCD